MNQARFVTGTGTDVGKTIVSALLALALDANYFKPIQSGTPTDSDFMRNVLGDKRVFAEAYRLTKPLSPNQAAACEKRHIDLSRITIAEKLALGSLIVEGAGGILSPINESETMVDLIAHLQLTTILVARSDLGTITHTLQSVRVLEQCSIPLSCIILFGPPNLLNQKDIFERTGITTITYQEIRTLQWKNL